MRCKPRIGRKFVRILLVEDEVKVARALREGLEAESYETIVASNGEEAFFLATTQCFDLLLLDVMLPGRNGLEILAALRQHGLQTPVLVLTAKDSVEDRVRGLDTGADDYLVKPFELAELLARLRALIRRSASQAQARLEIGSVVIDTAARTVTRNGEVVTLTAREYALVEFVALHRGTVVTRTTLYEHLFDETDDTLSNLLDVHVSNIRKKLGHEFITTRRGHGYSIE